MNLRLENLAIIHATYEYLSWLRDKDVNLHSDNQYRVFTLESQKNYIQSCIDDDNKQLLGIFDNEIHLGNILINGLRSHHKKAEISYFVGKKEYWGLGVASFAIAEAIKIARNTHYLNKLYAGLAEPNIGSKKALEKNGFVHEGTRKMHLFYNGTFHDQLDYGLILND